MSVSLALKIVAAVLALALGVWLGLPGRYDQTPDDIERDMEWGTGRAYKVKRHFTPLAWVQRQLKARGQRSRPRRSFQMESPDERDEEER
jgi:hypothetical protein